MPCIHLTWSFPPRSPPGLPSVSPPALSLRGGSKTKVAWTEEEEEELRSLFLEQRDSEGAGSLQLQCYGVLVRGSALSDPAVPSLSLSLCLCLPPSLPLSLSLSPVPDPVEALLPLLGATRSRRQVVLQLVHMGLVESAKQLKKHK